MMSEIRRLTTRRSAKWSRIALFLRPALSVYLPFVLIPIGQGAYYSLFKWNGLKPLTDFVGLANYARAIGDDLFVGAFTHNAMIIVLSLTVQIPFALGL